MAVCDQLTAILFEAVWVAVTELDAGVGVDETGGGAEPVVGTGIDVVVTVGTGVGEKDADDVGLAEGETVGPELIEGVGVAEGEAVGPGLVEGVACGELVETGVGAGERQTPTVSPWSR